MNFRDFRKNIIRSAGNVVLYFLINLLCSSLRIKTSGEAEIRKLEASGKNYILAFWHGTMLLPWFIHRNRNCAALVSMSKDGELLARILKKWGYILERGSSSREGKAALEQLVSKLREGRSVLITPDGPRGPRFQMKAGAVIAAKKTGLPLVLAGVGYRKKRELKSWDKFQIPKFFSDAVLIYSAPMFIDPELSYDETSAKIAESEKRLVELQNDAERSD